MTLKGIKCARIILLYLGHDQNCKMACVTLKRPVDVLGSPHMEQQPLSKRKRCGPPLFPSTPSPSTSPSRGFKRVKRMLEIDDQPVSPSSYGSKRTISPFLSVTPPIHTGNIIFTCINVVCVWWLYYPACTCRCTQCLRLIDGV